MKIALDYDSTYTEDPIFWDTFIASVRHHGHSIVCCTMRYPEEGDAVIEALGHQVDEIIFTGRKAKMQFLKDKGIEIGVWVDDSPHWIYQDALT